MFQWIVGLFKPAADLIDSLDISGNTKQKLKNELAKIEADLVAKQIELEKARLEMHSRLVAAEAASPHKINATWRPIASLTLVSIACLAAFDVISPNDNFYNLLSLVLGGHIITSSAGNGIAQVTKVLKK